MDLLTIEEVASILKMNVQVIRRKLREGKLKGVKLDREWRVERKDLEEYINSKKGGQ